MRMVAGLRFLALKLSSNDFARIQKSSVRGPASFDLALVRAPVATFGILHPVLPVPRRPRNLLPKSRRADDTGNASKVPVLNDRDTFLKRYRVDLRVNLAINPRQRRDALDVIRLREHVDGLDAIDAVAALTQDAEVARQCRGVAGDIDDPARLALE